MIADHFNAWLRRTAARVLKRLAVQVFEDQIYREAFVFADYCQSCKMGTVQNFKPSECREFTRQRREHARRTGTYHGFNPDWKLIRSK